MRTAPCRPGRRPPPAARRRWDQRSRDVSRLPVPEQLVRLIEFGLDYPELVRADYWQRVDEKACELLAPLLPEGRGLRLTLDPGGGEIVAMVSR